MNQSIYSIKWAHEIAGFSNPCDSFLVRSSAQGAKRLLRDAGFLVNVEKSVFVPSQSISWLGLCWDSSSYSISIPERRISELIDVIDSVLCSLSSVSARLLARVGGKVISMMPVIGNVARIKTRFLFRCIEARQSWDRKFCLSDQTVINELQFWRSNAVTLNTKRLCNIELPTVVTFTDASSYACAAYTQNSDFDVFHYMLCDTEILMSSTWRALKAIELYLQHFEDRLQGKRVKCFTDSQCAESVITVGSSKPHLHGLAISVFSICARVKGSLSYNNKMYVVDNHIYSQSLYSHVLNQPI